MIDVFAEWGAGWFATDIQPLTSTAEQSDFFSWQTLPHDASSIITNPPYKIATRFIEHALRLTEQRGGVVAMLLRTDFDHAKTRRHLFADHPAFAKKIVLRKRIRWFEPKPGEKKKSPSFNHAWFIWDWRHGGEPTIAWAA